MTNGTIVINEPVITRFWIACLRRFHASRLWGGLYQCLTDTLGMEPTWVWSIPRRGRRTIHDAPSTSLGR